MKKILFFCILALFMATSCSNSKDPKKDAPKAAKTVDLGESDANDGDTDKDKTKKDDKKAADKKSGNAKSADTKKKNDDADLTDEEIAKKNDEASKNEDGSAKRGKPAAEIEDDEAKNAPAKDKPKPDAAPDDEKGKDKGNNPDARPDGKKGPVPPPPPKPPKSKQNSGGIDDFINVRELREQTGFAGALTEDTLVGQAQENRYFSYRFATDNANELGFSIQVWKPGNESAASKRFNDLFAQSFGGSKIKTVATDAFVASHHKINELAFFDKGKRSTVLLSCSSSICSAEQLKNIALIIQRRLK